ncbi:MAG: SET domain-containing protein-lysine N-methyltransferase [Nostoc sp. DedQUE12b]|uniref:SET domain-containing protein n=1 Tax=Nostoc sp. DedQUE12b TaxID=3075398 RepID=UPI002AD4C406|nr:SET domain-containing protein-lysine N-methyltransferase [Nostoc sp. DedQUE12b]MDZ8086369.1 SET domain-containing protein-lysine N-methyltransferase [Nostoc sp. DedQUE12b]
MLHHSTEVRFVNSEIGYGIFATEPIPKGTIVVYEDPLDIEVTPDKFASLDVNFREMIDFFAYVNMEGNVVLNWNNAKYINHSCDFNTLITGYAVSIAVRNIAEGEEITLDYALLDACFKSNDRTYAVCKCGSQNCRKDIRAVNYKTYSPIWFSRMTEALNCALDVRQPLLDFMDSESKENLINALQSNPDYSQFQLVLIQQRQANFYEKWGKLLAEIG